MITIKLKLVCSEIFGAMPGGEYTLPEAMSAREALECCVAQYDGEEVLREYIHRVVFMLNGKHISPDTMVSEGDMLFVLRPVVGG